MNKLLGLALVALALCGCQGQRRYGAVLLFAGGSPEELDQFVAACLLPKPAINIERTVAERGRVQVFLRSSRSEIEIRQWLSATGRLPATVSIASLVRLPGELPDKPSVSKQTALVINVNREKCAALGLPVSEVEAAVRKLETTDPSLSSEATIQTTSGKQIRLADVAETTAKQIPSHVVRDY